jgi:NNP family nitrate/nitrite transporter-like MFS transporter
MLKEMWRFSGRYRVLHLTWLAFFLTFVVWFNFAPFASTIAKEMSLAEDQIKVLGICNLALTIPARIIIGMILDRFGPRITFSSILMFALIPCLATSLSQDLNSLVFSRLLMGIVGAGFVVGIRIVAEWFPPKEIGMAEGIYGGWGNFGAFGAEFALPLIAVGTAFLAGGQSNWRGTILMTGIVAAIYGFIYLCSVRDTPEGKTYRRPKRNGAMAVTSIRSFWAMCLSNFGLIFALGLLAWRLAGEKLHFLNSTQMYVIWGLLALLYIYQTYQAYKVNRELLNGTKRYSPEERYEFRQIALLEMCYVISFGSELAAISMLPNFFEKTFALDHHYASIIAATYPFMNLISRPSGGLISDKLGSRKWTMVIISVGIGFGYLLAHNINSNWSLGLAIVVTMISAYFAQAGCGSTYGIVPLIRKEISGQISGNVGAYGNFGGVVFLTIFSLTDAPTLFTTMGIAALVCASLCAFFLKEPKGSFASHDVEEEAVSELPPERVNEQLS